MTGARNTSPHDPTAEGTADQSTQTAGGLHQRGVAPRPGPGPEIARETEADDLLGRNEEGLYETPRRYDEHEQG